MLGRVHCETTEAPMSEMGQKHTLPQCKSNGRFHLSQRT